MLATPLTIFSVQDETGTVAQLTLVATSPAIVVSVGDTGTYSGIPDDGTEGFDPTTAETVPFVVGQVINPQQFSITTTNQNLADWPANGTILWLTGVNAGQISSVMNIAGANAYINEAFFYMYTTARGYPVPSSDDTAVQTAIVQACDYLDQRYRYKGIKLLQNLGDSMFDANAIFLDSWMTPYAINSMPYLTPSVTTQNTEWPRQGVVDLNGDTINGIPKQIKAASAELAWRVLSGIMLQPDYDPNLVSAGGVVTSVSKEVGPLKTSITYDTKLGLGFFASIPQVDRMLSRGGLLVAGGGRTLIR